MNKHNLIYILNGLAFGFSSTALISEYIGIDNVSTELLLLGFLALCGTSSAKSKIISELQNNQKSR